MSISKPMLAGRVKSLTDLDYPVIASPKLDGIRCITIANPRGGVNAVTRNWKLVPNRFIRAWLEEHIPIGFDGELMVHGAFNEVSSAIMSEEGEPNFFYAVFDYVKDSASTPFTQRVEDLKAAAKKIQPDSLSSRINDSVESHLWVVPQIRINDSVELKAYLDKCLAEGFEGLCVRTPNSPYKSGRSTENEAYLLKIKLFDDDEAVVTDMVAQMHNTNEAKQDAFGNTERSSAKAGLVATQKLGALQVKDLKTGIQFEIGTGFNDAQRMEYWANQNKYIGKIVKYSHQGVGINQKPRFPVFLGFRDPHDMDA